MNSKPPLKLLKMFEYLADIKHPLPLKTCAKPMPKSILSKMKSGAYGSNAEGMEDDEVGSPEIGRLDQQHESKESKNETKE